jgi:uncharacterized protein (TIGR02594 family)
MRVILFCLLITGCAPLFTLDKPKENPSEDIINTAEQFTGLSEKYHRRQLAETLGVDPVSTEWCAAFVNAVLDMNDIQGSGAVSDNPLLARSFLKWGYPVNEAQSGDILVFPRGNKSWQGHVGIHASTVYIDGEKWYWVLGGNQSNSVSFKLYPASYALGIRRPIL